MNRNELIDFIRDPASLTSENLTQLEEIVAEAPYFQSARMLLAKGSAILKEPATKKRVASAAIYATDRPLLKKYMSGNLLFLTKAPAEAAEEEKAQQVQGADKKVDVPSKPSEAKTEKDSSALTTEAPTDDKLFIPGIPVGALDAILEELEHDMEELKSSRSKFADLQDQLEDEDGVFKETEIAEEMQEEPLEVSTSVDEILTEKASEQIPEAEPASIEPESNVESTEIEPPLEKETGPSDAEPQTGSATEEPVEEKPLDTEEEIVSVEEEKNAENVIDEDDEIEKAITEKLKDLQQSTPEIPEEPAEEIMDEKAEVEDTEKEQTPLMLDQLTEVKLESDIKREKRMEKRLEREKRLSSLHKLSPSSIKKLEDQMWGDADDEPEKPAEKEEGKPEIDKSEADDKKEVKKETTKEPKSTESTKKSSATKKSVEEKSSTKESAKASTKKTETKKPTTKKETAKKAAEKEVKPKEPAKKTATKKKETKTTAKKETTKKAEPNKTVAKKTTSKTTTTKKPAANKTATKATTPTTKKAAAKTTTARKTTAKGTTKKSTIKKATPKKKNDDDPNAEQEKIIERFIKENPSITKVTKKIKNEADLSAKSSAWNKDLASEYLAEIYLNQGNRQRAIEIYKALSLKFPQKKSYFADLISKIK